MRKRKDKPQYVRVPADKNIKMGIAVPKMEYRVVKDPVLETAFTGNVTVLPTVLLFYLKPGELRLVATIMQEIMEKGECILTTKQFCLRLQITLPTYRTYIHNLLKMHIVSQKRSGWQFNRSIDFDSVQHLDDLLNAEDRGVYVRLRKRCKNKNINNITQEDLGRIYDQYVLPPDHDPEEEEEYD